MWGVNGVNYRKTINDNMLVIVQIETPIGAWNTYPIARQPGVDVGLASNGDMTNFPDTTPAIPDTRCCSRRCTTGVRAGKFLGAVTGPTVVPARPESGVRTLPTGGCSTTARHSTVGSPRE